MAWHYTQSLKDGVACVMNNECAYIGNAKSQITSHLFHTLSGRVLLLANDFLLYKKMNYIDQ